jgi:hypothetical protein
MKHRRYTISISIDPNEELQSRRAKDGRVRDERPFSPGIRSIVADMDAFCIYLTRTTSSGKMVKSSLSTNPSIPCITEMAKWS